MTSKFYYEIADELLKDSTFQNYRRDLEHISENFEQHVMAIFEIPTNVKEQQVGGISKMSADALAKEIDKAYGEKTGTKLGAISNQIINTFRNKSLGSKTEGHLLYQTSDKLLKEHEDLTDAVDDFIFASVFDNFMSNLSKQLIDDNNAYKKAISQKNKPLELRDLLLEKTNNQGLYSSLLKYLAKDAYSESRGASSDQLNQQLDELIDASSDLTTQAVKNLETVVDDLGKDKNTKQFIKEKVDELEEANKPGVDDLVSPTIITAIQKHIAEILGFPNQFAELIKKNSENATYQDIFTNKLKAIDTPEQKNRLENLYNILFQGEMPKKEEGKIALDNKITQVLDAKGKNDEVLTVLSADISGFMLSKIKDFVKRGNVAQIKASNLDTIAHDYVAQLKQSLSRYKPGAMAENKGANEEVALMEGAFLDAIKKDEIEKDDAILRIGRYVYKYIVQQNDELKNLPEDEIEKQVYDLVEEYVSQLDSKENIQHAMSIISTNTKNATQWKKLLDKYSTPDTKTKVEKYFKVLLGDMYAAYLNREDQAQTGPTLTLNEAWKNLELIDKQTTDNIITGVWKAIETNRERIDKLIDAAYNKVVQPMLQKSQRNIGATYQKTEAQTPTAPAGQVRPEAAEYIAPTPINRLYTFEEFMNMKPYSEVVNEQTAEPETGDLNLTNKGTADIAGTAKSAIKSAVGVAKKAIKSATTGEEGQARAKAVRYTIASIILYSVGLVMQTINENVEAVETGKEGEETNEEYYAEFIVAAAATYLLGKALSPFIGNFISQFGKMPDNFKDLDRATFEKAMRKAIEASDTDKSGFKEALAGLGFDTVADGYSEKLFSKEGLTAMLKTPENKKQFGDLVNKAIEGVNTQLGQISQKTIESMIEKTYAPSKGVAKGREMADRINKKIQGAKW